MRTWFCALGVLLCGWSYRLYAMAPAIADPTLQFDQQAIQSWPVAAPLPAPNGLRPCCAFGYNLKAQLAGLPVPFYQIDNVVQTDRLGEHHYNDSHLRTLAYLMGLSREKDGLIYTRRGGFIDLAHIRDTADYTLFLFSHIWPRLGQAGAITLGEELTRRQIALLAFTPPASPAQRYTLAAYLAARLAFQLAAWHEIAQWYGFESVPGFSEGISAFSPEDLYSNLVGARLALTVILAGHADSLEDYARGMQALIPQALQQLGAVSAAQTRFQFDMLDGRWWNSHRRVPQKYMVLYRDYCTGDNRPPAAVPGERMPPMHLRLPQQVGAYPLDQLAELELWPGDRMAKLPLPAPFYTARDFPALAWHASVIDARTLNAQPGVENCR